MNQVKLNLVTCFKEDNLNQYLCVNEVTLDTWWTETEPSQEIKDNADIAIYFTGEDVVSRWNGKAWVRVEEK